MPLAIDPDFIIEQLREQNARLLERAEVMQRFIATFPVLLMKARLDAKEMVKTRYDYATHNRPITRRSVPSS